MHRRIVILIAVAIATTSMLVAAGCSTRTAVESGNSTASIIETGAVSPAEVARAKRVLVRHLAAYGANDLRVLRETSVKNTGDLIAKNPQPLARWKGYRATSVTPLRDDDSFVLQLRSELWRQDYTAVQLFHVRGVFPHSEPGDVLPEDFEAIMVRTTDGKWLYLDSGPDRSSGP